MNLLFLEVNSQNKHFFFSIFKFLKCKHFQNSLSKRILSLSLNACEMHSYSI